MTAKLYKLDNQRSSSLDQVREAPESAFKPLALPAVVAAVRILARPGPRPPVHRELPPMLRQQAGSN